VGWAESLQDALERLESARSMEDLDSVVADVEGKMVQLTLRAGVDHAD
jgi:hypothetical protein